MKKIIILLLSFSLSGIIYAQHIPSHVIVFKLYFKDKQVDAAGYKFFEFLNIKEKKKDLSGDPLEIRFDEQYKTVVYTSYDDSIMPGLTIIHDIDTMKITFPKNFVYVDKVPFAKGKYILLGNVPEVTYEEQSNYKYWNQTMKFDFCENCKFRNYSLYNWNFVKVADETPAKKTPPKKK